MGFSDFAIGAGQSIPDILERRRVQQLQAIQQRMAEERQLMQKRELDLRESGQNENKRQFDAQHAQRLTEFDFSQATNQQKADQTARADQDFGRYLGSVPAHLKPVVEARRWGINVGVHDTEDPAQHTAHVAEEEAAKQRGQLDLHEGKAKIDARYQPAPQPRDERLVQIMGDNGTPIWVRESQAVNKPAAQAARAVTGQERQTLAYYNRAKEADESVVGLEDQIAQAGLGSQLQQQYAPNMLQTGPQQQYRQAQRAFTEARLRKESGAAIPVAEYENDAKTYFAQPGDTPQVREQKRMARQTVLKGLQFASGKAHDEFYGDQPQQQRPAAPSGKVTIRSITPIQ